jgi:hypothetical protein
MQDRFYTQAAPLLIPFSKLAVPFKSGEYLFLEEALSFNSLEELVNTHKLQFCRIRKYDDETLKEIQVLKDSLFEQGWIKEEDYALKVSHNKNIDYYIIHIGTLRWLAFSQLIKANLADKETEVLVVFPRYYDFHKFTYGLPF